MRRCSQTTAKGKPCKSWAVAGTDRCAAHLKLVGRKTLLTEELTVRLETLLRSGVPLSSALASVGIAKRTFNEWLTRDEPKYVVFAETIEQARARGEVTLIAQIANASPTNWQAAAWLLERSVPERWARISQRKQVDVPETTDDPFAEFDELAAKRAAKP